MTHEADGAPTFDLKVGEFLDRLASGEPAPGGGAAAAVAGAMGAALVSMVCGLTSGREKYKDVEAELGAVSAAATMARANFLLLSQRDQDAFTAVMQAFRLPKGTDAEKSGRQAAIQAGLQEATRVPLSTLQQAVELLPGALTAIDKGNANARSDAASAYFLTQAAADGALLNVKINLGGLKDEDFKQGILAAVKRALDERRRHEERAAELIRRYFPD
ncbi:MAG: cyclodeaminase/cyclohydrolase family protein [Symbiobacteriia bacterium]